MAWKAQQRADSCPLLRLWLPEVLKAKLQQGWKDHRAIVYGPGSTIRQAEPNQQVHLCIHLSLWVNSFDNWKHHKRKNKRRRYHHEIHQRPQIKSRDTAHKLWVLNRNPWGIRILRKGRTSQGDRSINWNRHKKGGELHSGPKDEGRDR